jgi:DNA-binding transcriptional LysR family regulator
MRFAMNVRQLEIFEAIMRIGSVTGAARSLNMTQPAVSKILKHAEDYLHFKLFERLNGRLCPTAEAKALFPEVERVFSHLDLINRMELDLKNNMSGRIAIATPVTLADSVVSDAIARFGVSHPRVRFAIHVASTRDVIEATLKSKVDFGVTFVPVEHALIDQEEIGKADIVCTMPRNHALAKRRTIGPLDLKDCRLIAGDRQTSYGYRLEEAFRSVGETANVCIEVTTSIVACALVLRGAGVALTDPFAALRWHPRLIQKPFRPRIQVNPRVISLRGTTLPRVAAEFLPYLKEALPSPNHLPRN